MLSPLIFECGIARCVPVGKRKNKFDVFIVFGHERFRTLTTKELASRGQEGSAIESTGVLLFIETVRNRRSLGK